MAFFVISLAVFGSGYAYVGMRLTGSLGAGSSALVWTLLVLHLASIFVSFGVMRSVGPTPITTPFFWFVYAGMGLFSLVFTGLVLGDLGVLSIFSSETLKHITKIDVSSNQITHEGVQSIADSCLLPKLEILDLSNNKIGDQGFITLIGSKNYPKLLDLRLDTNKIT